MGAAGRVSVALTGAATTILVARLLGPGGAGGFAVSLTIVYVLTVLTTLGVEHGIVYEISGRRWPARAAFATSQQMAVLMGVLGAATGVAVRVALPSAFGGLSITETAIAASALPFSLSWFYGSFVALADDRYEAYVLPSAVQSAVLLGLGAALTIPFGLSGAVVALAVSHAITAAGTVLLARCRWRGVRPVAANRLRAALSFGVKGYAANALQVLNYRVDVFVLSAVAPATAVGRYSVAVAATSVLWLLPQALSDVLFPRVAALSASQAVDAEAQRDLVEDKSLRHTSLIVGVSLVVLTLALLFLVVPIYGPAFRGSIVLGLLRLPGAALVGLSRVMLATVVGRGHPRLGLQTALVTTPLTLLLYAMLIPAFHGPGAALASSLGFAWSFVIGAVAYRRVTGRSALTSLVPTRAELDDYRTLWATMRSRARLSA